jgi:transposase-like protein
MMSLSPRQMRLALAMGAPPSYRAACRKLGISPRTAARWKRKPEFQDAVQRAVKAKCQEGNDAVLSAFPVAVRVLRQLLKSDEESIRLRAATAILQHRLGAMAERELAERLAKLEATLGALGRTRP